MLWRAQGKPNAAAPLQSRVALAELARKGGHRLIDRARLLGLAADDIPAGLITTRKVAGFDIATGRQPVCASAVMLV